MNQNFNLTGQETFTIEDPNPTFESSAPETQSRDPRVDNKKLADLELELKETKHEKDDLINRNHVLEDQVDDLNYQIKRLKKVNTHSYSMNLRDYS